MCAGFTLNVTMIAFSRLSPTLDRTFVWPFLIGELKELGYRKLPWQYHAKYFVLNIHRRHVPEVFAELCFVAFFFICALLEEIDTTRNLSLWGYRHNPGTYFQDEFSVSDIAKRRSSETLGEVVLTQPFRGVACKYGTGLFKVTLNIKTKTNRYQACGENSFVHIYHRGTHALCLHVVFTESISLLVLQTLCISHLIPAI